MPRHDIHVIRRVDQLAAIVSPVRQRVMAALRELGQGSVAEVAEHLGESVEKLYYHVHALVEVGLLVEVGKRPGTRRPESVFRLIKPGLIVDPRRRSARYLDTLASLYGATIREANRNLERALQVERKQPRGEDRTPGVLVTHARLSRSDQRKLRAMLLEIGDFMAERDDPDQQRVSLTAVLTPVVAQPTARRKAMASR